MPTSLKRNHGRADALCWFGATGDLGYKMTIPGLYAMARHGHLDVHQLVATAHDQSQLIARFEPADRVLQCST